MLWAIGVTVVVVCKVHHFALCVHHHQLIHLPPIHTYQTGTGASNATVPVSGTNKNINIK
jgi:hypothetical protein